MSALGLVLALASSVSAQPTNPPATQPFAPRPPAPRRPNIIFILADDLGYGDLGCYGQTKIKTPNLDRLAAEGMRFTDFYAGSTVCAPSRCALMTGLHTGHCLIRGNAKVALREQDVTVASILKDSGYFTGLIGKWGLGNEGTTGVPQRQGFDEFAGYLDQTHAHNYYTDYLWRYDPRASGDTPEADVSKGRRPMVLPENQGLEKKLYIPDLLANASLQFIKLNKQTQLNHFRPFFLEFATIIPHANNEEARRSGNGMQVPSDAPYSDEPWPQAEKNKAAMIARLDADVGRLLDTLQQLKMDEDTVVFFSSDNGPHKEGGVDPEFFKSSGPFRGIKRDLYEGGIRVPLIVRWPGKIKPGQVNHGVFAFWDFLPTAAEIAQVKPPRDIDGISFLPSLLGKAQTNQHAALYWEFHERGFQQAARVGDWKAVRLKAGGPIELYNLKADPGEKNNVADQNPQVVAKMEAYLKSARTESEHWPVKRPVAARPAEKS